MEGNYPMLKNEYRNLGIVTGFVLEALPDNTEEDAYIMDYIINKVVDYRCHNRKEESDFKEGIKRWDRGEDVEFVIGMFHEFIEEKHRFDRDAIARSA